MDILLPLQPSHRGRGQGGHPPHILPARTRGRDGRRRLQQDERPPAVRRGGRSGPGRRRERNGRRQPGLRRQRSYPRAATRVRPRAHRSPALLLRAQDIRDHLQALRGNHAAGHGGRRHAQGLPRSAKRPPRSCGGRDARGRVRAGGAAGQRAVPLTRRLHSVAIPVRRQGRRGGAARRCSPRDLGRHGRSAWRGHG